MPPEKRSGNKDQNIIGIIGVRSGSQMPVEQIGSQSFSSQIFSGKAFLQIIDAGGPLCEVNPSNFARITR
jgi:hypothetical protein